MQLKKIEILKYKSINSPVTINFNHGEPVALIGKNGSGKTNILEALKLSFSNGHYFPNHKKQTGLSTYYFTMSAEDKNRYFKDIELNEEDGLIKVNFKGNEPTIRTISSPAVQIIVREFREEAETILKDFELAGKNYISNLQEIEMQNTKDFMLYTEVDWLNDKGSLTYINDNNLQEVKRQINERIKSIQNTLDAFKDDFILDNSDYSGLHINLYPIRLYTIANKKLTISPIIAKSLGITKEKLEVANLKLNNNIKRINRNLKESYNALTQQIDKFNKLTDKIKATFYKVNDDINIIQGKKETTRALFMQDLKNAVFKNCYYIDNENTLLFSPSPDNQYSRHQASIENFRTQNPLLEAFHNFLLSRKIYKEQESILDYSKLDPNRRKKFVELINNEFLANYIQNNKKNEIKGLLLKEENNQLNLYIKENNGSEINVNETSLGRRWYLTYRFVKSIIKPGDILLIDEPAAFLHPQAQQEIKRELEQLTKSGIFVIYTTHSPYMIPANWGQVYNIENTENGTEITKFNSDDELSAAIKEHLGITRSADILFNLDKTLLIIEGVADKTCVEKFAQLLGYDISEYKIHICDGEAILQVAYIYLKIGIEKVYMLLDNDNKYKPEYFKKSHSMYQECIDEIEKNKDKCIYIGTSETGCLEDYFKDSNNKFKHYDTKKQRWKIDVTAINAITNKNEVCTETLNNFEQLFKKLEIPPLDKTK